ncbi:MAG TPA: tetratricopeptide repeat protein [Gemmatimonadaceae bacterium]|nr:tetratricopeptide repeat protein [Gemmatimonadaceae bacterium]
MSARKRYTLLVVALAAAAVAGAAVSIPAIRGWRVWGPLAHRAKQHPDSTPKRVARAKPPASLPAVAPVPAPAQSTAIGQSHPPVRVNVAKAWKPSERQQLRDKLYLAGQANRPSDAIAALEAWDAKHPRDPEALRELSRLLVRNGRVNDGLARYRELLTASPDSGARAEYAAALLALQQYDSAAANYRILINADSNDLSARVGLARALAWGNHPREAEPELRWVTLRVPGDTTFVVMLRVARNSYDPTSADAARWVGEDPQYVPYRLTLARLLASEGRLDLAAAQFDTLVSGNSSSLALIREAAGVHAMAGDSIGDARLLRRAVALAPADTGIRQSYAEALAWSGDRASAVAQYDTLLAASGSDPDLLIARARLYAVSGDNAAAERDLSEAIAKRPTPEAWVMLGDLYRWEGDRSRAWSAYSEASALRPGDAAAEGGFAELAAAERRQKAAVLSGELGWNTFASYLGDNAGFDLSIAGLGGGMGIGPASALLLGADARRLGSDQGEAAYLGVVQYFRSYRFSAEGGAVTYRERGDFGYGSVSAAGALGGLWTSAEVRTGPTFQWLMSPRTLTYRGASASLTIPAGLAAFSFGVDRMWLSDGNDRTQLQLGARYALWRGVSAIYSGGMIGFDHASASYWDPRRFTSHSMGLELSTQRDSGFSVSARVLPGIGVMSDGFDATIPGARTAAQLSTGLALAYRRRWWSLTLDGDYAHGVRDSGYQSARASARLRITP